MSLLENLRPTKEITSFQINAYDEDIELFNQALKYLEKKNKQSFGPEVLFEHFIGELKKDNDFMNYMKKSRRKPTGKKAQ